MDTTHIEYTAEDLIAHKLQRNGLLVAKPKFDRDGADLIALLDVADGAKFCRIQCKGRSLKRSKNSNVKMPVDYVSGSFFVFLYVDTGDKETHIFCFSVDDIKKYWNQKTENNKVFYCLNIYKNTFLDPSNETNLLSFSFDPTKIALIKEGIKKSNSREEIKLFKLVKNAQELIQKTKEYNELKELISKIQHLEEVQKLHGKNLELLTAQYNNLLPEFEKELPQVLISKINGLLEINTPVPEITEKLKEIIPTEIPISILEDFITNVLIQKEKI